jgi:hypothetical protein
MFPTGCGAAEKCGSGKRDLIPTTANLPKRQNFDDEGEAIPRLVNSMGISTQEEVS